MFADSLKSWLLTSDAWLCLRFDLAFQYLPMVFSPDPAVLPCAARKVICMHGGLSPELQHFDQAEV